MDWVVDSPARATETGAAPLRVVIVQGAFLPVPPLSGGAVEKLWFELGLEFARRGLRVTHVSRAWPGLPARETRDGVEHRRVGGHAYTGQRLRDKLRDLVYSVRVLAALPPADVTVTNTFFLPVLLSLLPRRHGALYLSVHRYPQGQMGLYRRADRLQCVSTAVADAVREQSPSVAARVKVVPNYVKSWRDPDAVAAAWDAREREVLFVGRVHPEKGVDLLLRAFASIEPARRDGWRVVVVGPHAQRQGGGGEDYRAALERLAADLGVAVDWVGPVFDPAALDAHYARARVMVYPTTAARGEAFPLAPLEAQSQGCPVVTSDLRCFADYIEPGRNGAMFAIGHDDPAPRLGAVLADLLADDDRLRAYSAAGLATAQRFTLARVADAFIDDFRSLRRR